MRMTFMALTLTVSLSALDKETIDSSIDAILGKKGITTVSIGKNPFVGAKTPSPEVAPQPPSQKRGFDLKVAGIINKKALIGGTLYRTGERVNGYEIQSITERGVTFIKNGMFYAARLSTGEDDILIKRDR